MWRPPVTDRTQQDVSRALALISKGYDNLTPEEQAEWDAGLKGCRNISDLNRIIENIDFLAALKGTTGTGLPEQTYSGWITDTYVYGGGTEDTWYIINALRELNEALQPDEPIPTDWLTYDGLNALESLLLTFSEAAGISAFPTIFTGEVFAGEENLI